MAKKYKLRVEQILVSRENSWTFEIKNEKVEIILEMAFEEPEKAEREFEILADQYDYMYCEDSRKGWFKRVTLIPSVTNGGVYEELTRRSDNYSDLVDRYG